MLRGSIPADHIACTTQAVEATFGSDRRAPRGILLRVLAFVQVFKGILLDFLGCALASGGVQGLDRGAGHVDFTSGSPQRAAAFGTGRDDPMGGCGPAVVAVLLCFHPFRRFLNRVLRGRFLYRAEREDREDRVVRPWFARSRFMGNDPSGSWRSRISTRSTPPKSYGEVPAASTTSSSRSKSVVTDVLRGRVGQVAVGAVAAHPVLLGGGLVARVDPRGRERQRDPGAEVGFLAASWFGEATVFMLQRPADSARSLPGSAGTSDRAPWPPGQDRRGRSTEPRPSCSAAPACREARSWLPMVQRRRRRGRGWRLGFGRGVTVVLHLRRTRRCEAGAVRARGRNAPGYVPLRSSASSGARARLRDHPQ